MATVGPDGQTAGEQKRWPPGARVPVKKLGVATRLPVPRAAQLPVPPRPAVVANQGTDRQTEASERHANCSRLEAVATKQAGSVCEEDAPPSALLHGSWKKPSSAPEYQIGGTPFRAAGGATRSALPPAGRL